MTPMDFARASVVPSEPSPNVFSINFRMLPNSYCVCEIVPGVDVRRDDEHRNAETQAAGVVEERRRDVIVETAPVVPHDDDGRRVPVAALRRSH